MTIRKVLLFAGSLLAVALLMGATGAADARRGGGHGGGGWGGGHGGGWSGHSGGFSRGFSSGRSSGFERSYGSVGRFHGYSGGHRHFGGSHAFRHGGGHHHHHFRRHRHVHVYAPYYAYDYGYGYGDSCYWLKRRALYSGSSYWWSRYYNCIDGYY